MDEHTKPIVKPMQCWRSGGEFLGYFAGIMAATIDYPNRRALVASAIKGGNPMDMQEEYLHNTPEKAMAIWEDATPTSINEGDLRSQLVMLSRETIKQINEEGLYRTL